MFQYFLELMKVPRVESKFRVFSFKIQFRTQITEFKKSLNTVNAACEEVRNSFKLKEIMKKILYLGNTLNQGTTRGAAVGFKLDSLLKLTETRASNSKMTLMHFLCKVLADRFPGLLDFHLDLVNLEAATKIQLKSLAEEMQAIIRGLEKVKQELVASKNDGPVSEVFRKGLRIGENPRRSDTWDPIVKKCERKLTKWKQKLLSFGGRRRFLWGGGVEEKKIAWVKWESVCLPKEKGGIGIRDIRKFNYAFLGKWKWSFFYNKGELWARILDSKYGDWRHLEEATRGNRASTWWKDINIIDPSATGWEWNFKWRRQLYDDEMEMAVKFLQDLEDISIHPDREDKWIWKEDASGVYSAGSEYKKLMSAQTDENQDGVFTELWKVKAPSKAAFFAWRLLEDRLPTKMNLRRRNVEINDPTCPFCKYKDEDATYIFFSCRKILPFWWKSVSWTNTSGPLPQIPRMHFLQHVVWNKNGSSSQILKCWWISLTWSIWQHRNNIIFEGTILMTLKEFIAVAESEVVSVTNLYSVVGRNADALALYFGEDPSRCPFEQVTATLFNFTRLFLKAHEQNCKQAELEKKKVEKEAEMEKAKGINLIRRSGKYEEEES
ncbi:Formin-like protein 20 [Glycine soja]|uniref:Formin-like protein 20 n=1 Tax=Glycine soja TaxID=3848 RepID=A0A445L147_GLYSO|nr:Formin-like protein 20 [Glycine soja]